MMVLVMERVSASTRGELTRWLLEPRTGVFVGRVSALVREKLWSLACEKAGAGAVTLVYHTDSAQGFALRTAGRTSRAVIDLEGLLLVRI